MNKQTTRIALTGGRGDPPNDPNGAGWPSTTGNPSGDGRGNNDIRQKSFKKKPGQPDNDPKEAGYPAADGKGPSGKERGNDNPKKKK